MDEKRHLRERGERHASFASPLRAICKEVFNLFANHFKRRSSSSISQSKAHHAGLRGARLVQRAAVSVAVRSTRQEPEPPAMLYGSGDSPIPINQGSLNKYCNELRCVW